MTKRTLFASLLVASLLTADSADKAFYQKLSEDQKTVHALQRLTYGPRPGDIETIERGGLDRWIELQLHPQRLEESPTLYEKLATLKTLTLPSRDVAKESAPLVARELTAAKLYRAVYSDRQLEEQLVDFWFNHFNVNLSKGADRFLTTAYERDAIRPHIWGKFRDLLGATAHHPAMLFYLDNWRSVAPTRTARQAKAKRASAINENYARELLELHTMGVDRGYTQQDIIEVARCLTGWTILEPLQGGEFVFNARIHDGDPKKVLGTKIPAGGGQDDGERVLDILAKRTETAQFIARKLAQRFVADDPPSKLVDRMTRKFRDTDGDLRAVVKAMIESPEFFSQGAQRAKLKSPFEFVVSALRASVSQLTDPTAIAQRLADMGQPLYRKVEPTGYSTLAEEWLNTSGLLARANFAAELSAKRLRGVTPTVAANLTAPDFQRR
jgi:uncharacterized protein (DUF1800 family)